MLYREDMSLLFDDTAVAVKTQLAGDAIIHLIKWKDIVADIEQTLDHCKKISDMILGVVMKYDSLLQMSKTCGNQSANSRVAMPRTVLSNFFTHVLKYHLTSLYITALIE